MKGRDVVTSMVMRVVCSVSHRARHVRAPYGCPSDDVCLISLSSSAFGRRTRVAMQRIVVSQQGVVASASASRQRQSRSAEACVHPRRSAERQVQDVQLRAPGSTSALSASCSSHRSRRRVGRLHATAGTPTRDPHDVDDGDVPTPGYASIESALKHVSEGKFVVVMDDEDRENEGDLIIAADKVTPEAMAFMIRHTSGVVCVSLEDERCKALQLPPMVQDKVRLWRLRAASSRFWHAGALGCRFPGCRSGLIVQ